MTKYVLFSAGYDSTAVAHKIAKETSRDDCIRLLMIKHHNLNDEQWELQNKKMIQFEKYLSKTNTILCEDIEIKSTLQCNCSRGLAQQLWWIIYSLDFIGNNSEVYFGYHAGDQYWSYINEMEQIKTSIEKIRGIKIKFKYPLKDYEKDDIIRYIKDHKLEKYCITCENPKKGKPCGKCNKCIELKVFEYKMNLIDKTDVEVACI